MISVIVCSPTDMRGAKHREHVVGSIGSSHEYILIDNKDKRLGLCAAYNEGVSRASGDIFVFVHDDVFFVNYNS